MARELMGAKEILGAEAPGNAVSVVDVPEKRQRAFPIGFVSTGQVPLNGQVDIPQKPQLLYRVDRVVVSDMPAILSNPAAIGTIADNFAIVNVIAGQQIMQVASGELDGTAFKPTTFGTRMLFQTVDNGWELILRVHNRDQANALDFYAVMFGICFAA
jgi:hypothetical protein